ncbi:MAG: YeeE/YedE family protein [Rhodospirillales bacterium]|nr:YeeE/YedE family protein [Rhodospirillales bacterium]
MENFTPVAALVGGGLIGLGAVVLMAFTGRIAGISGIIGGLVGRDWSWRLAFVAGLIGGPFLAQLFSGQAAETTVTASTPVLVAAGLLVGFGTRLGSGCTSGHGVCGLAHFSPRSLAATLTFMGVGAIVVFIVRHVIGG